MDDARNALSNFDYTLAKESADLAPSLAIVSSGETVQDQNNLYYIIIAAVIIVIVAVFILMRQRRT